MFLLSYIIRHLFSNFKGYRARVRKPKHAQRPIAGGQRGYGRPVSKRLNDNLREFTKAFQNSADVVIREFDLMADGSHRAAIIFIDGLVDGKVINEHLMQALMLEAPGVKGFGVDLFDWVTRKALVLGHVTTAETVDSAIDHVLLGATALLIDGCPKVIVCDTKGWKTRGIHESPSEAVVRGPRESFTEDLRTNTSLIRRKIRSPELKFEEKSVGRRTRTRITIAYLEGVAQEKTLNEVRARLDRIDIDGVLETAYVEELIEDAPYSPFPTIAHTEKPDVVAAKLLEGRVSILVDGTPFALTVPALFAEYIQSPEDYYERYPIASLVRIIRFVSFLIALFLPSLYIAVLTYHPEILPTRLMLGLAAAREGIPFPGFLEIVLMEFTFEALRESGIRMPRPLGQALSIIGALVLGDAAIRARLASPGAVMVVAFTGIASFAIPVFAAAISMRILRFIMMLLGATLGLFGVTIGLLMMLIHLASLRSFGMPYLSPIAPLILRDLRDVVVRAPWWAMRTRPAFIGQQDVDRLAPGSKPAPPRISGRRYREPDDHV